MDARLDPTDPSLFFRLVSSRLAPDRENDADPTAPSTRLLTSIVPDRAPFETTSKSKSKSKQVLPPHESHADERDGQG
jgi:hypothetical protein